MRKVNISEIFFSIQGEGPLVGLPFLFVRFCGCNLQCAYCDTKWNWKISKYCRIGDKIYFLNPISIEDFNNIISRFKFDYVSFTGGEPMLYSDFIKESLGFLDGKKILIETNGTIKDNIDETLIDRIDYWSVDIKLPSLIGENLFEVHKAFLFRLRESRGQVILKAIFSENTSCRELFEVFEIAFDFFKLKSEICLVFQPVFRRKSVISREKLRCIFDIMNMSRFEVRLLPQTHKFLGIK